MARAIILVLCAGPTGALIGAPISTLIMTGFNNVYGLAGWQWMFLLEGLPAILLGIIALFYLADRPEHADWLSHSEKAALLENVKRTENRSEQSLVQTLKSARIYIVASAYFCLICGIYAVSFWLPTVLNTAGVTNLMAIELFCAIPYLAAIIMMYLLGKSSDRHNERHWHSALTAIGSAIALVPLIFNTPSLSLALLSITLATGFIYASYAVFWAIPANDLKETSAAAGGIAFINSIGLLGGFFSPTIIGWTKTITGSLQSGFVITGCLLILGALLIMFTQLSSGQSCARSHKSKTITD